MNISTRVIVGAVAMTVAVALLGARLAFAQGPSNPGGQGPSQRPGGPPVHGGSWGLMAPVGGWDEIIADTLGISVEQFQAARDEGKTLADLADELDVDLTSVREALAEARSEELSEAVEAGIITLDRADWMAEHGPMGMRRGLGPGMGRFGSDCFSAP